MVMMSPEVLWLGPPSGLGRPGAATVASVGNGAAQTRILPFVAELRQSAVEYHPFAISCWGRLHPQASAMVRALAKFKARREGSTCDLTIYRQLIARLTTLVWRRAARMALRCRPRAADDERPCGPLVDDACVIRAGDSGRAELPAFP